MAEVLVLPFSPEQLKDLIDNADRDGKLTFYELYGSIGHHGGFQ